MAEIDEYDYQLPRQLIAQTPLARRSDARLMVVDRRRGCWEHLHVRDLPGLLGPADCLVLNDTRVIPARLLGFRTHTGGRWEALFLEASREGLWRVMCKTRGRLVPGESITLINAQGREDIQLRMGPRQDDGTWVVRPMTAEAPLAVLERVGRVPLPPYIRKGEMIQSDRESYQTVYARQPGAIAAPTAGLHFTRELLNQIERRGTKVVTLTLHVGVGTFKPIESRSLA
ncbi:MAG TPA: S-adenosylmethionine:tRNA ribosyltransferase-isomerase, partial [Planctomycetaceae bacterium]|nr:S-adenosylmethionine:tRNA ribosyltransferase-isomerase [Planctomycetaceae bacterium]